jgi:hypothetical protein
MLFPGMIVMMNADKRETAASAVNAPVSSHRSRPLSPELLRAPPNVRMSAFLHSDSLILVKQPAHSDVVPGTTSKSALPAMGYEV